MLWKKGNMRGYIWKKEKEKVWYFCSNPDTSYKRMAPMRSITYSTFWGTNKN